MTQPLRLQFSEVHSGLGETILRPLLPIHLKHQGIRIRAMELLDSGSDINILPYSMGLSLGFRWDDHPPAAGVSVSG